MAEALYRKYRPQVFEDVVGQEPIERTLKNAIAQDKVSHAYLFCGPRGTGKTTTARLLAKALLCQSGPTPDPDGTCDDCRLIADGVHPDVYELDAASRTGVENVREEIISRVQFAPTRGRSKVYIIDEVHMLSTAAFNALLKTLEEPPSHVVFVLCTTDPQKVPETIHSRCQRFDFRRIAPESMVSRLGAICIAEGVEFEGEALDLIAHRAEGGLRNALTSLEQIIAFENGRVTLAGAERLLGSIDSNDMAEIVTYVGRRDVANCFRWVAGYVETGADLAQFVRDMAEHVRNLYVLALVGDDVELDVGETMRAQLSRELTWFGPDRLARLLGVLGDLSAELKTSSNPRLAFEIALTRMVRPDSDLTLESLAERIEALESGYSAVAHVLPGPQVVGASAGGPMEMAAYAQAAGMSMTGRAADTTMAASAEAVGAETKGQVASYAAAPAFEPQPAWRDGTVSQETQPAQFEQQAQSAQETSVSQAQAGHLSQAEQAGQATRMGRVAQGSQGASSQEMRAGDQARESYLQVASVPTSNGQFTPTVSSAASESQGATGAASSVAAVGGKLSMLSNPATMQRIWQAVLSAIKKQKQAYGVLFMNTKAQYDAGVGAVRVTFPAEAAFAFNAVKKPDVQAALADALGHAVGDVVPFTLERAGEKPIRVQSTSSGASAKEQSAQSQPIGQTQVQPAAVRAEQRIDERQMAQQDEKWSEAQQQEVQQRAAQQDSIRQAAQQEENQLVTQQQPAHQRVEQQQPPYQQAVQQQTAKQQMAQQQEVRRQAEQQQVVQQPYRPEERPAELYGSQLDSQAASQPPFAADQPPYDEVPYEEVPYEDVPYDEVPYEDFASVGDTPIEAGYGFEPTAQKPGQMRGNAMPDATTTPSRIEPNLTPDGAIAEDPASIEAMLQAGFGGEVIFREVDEE